MGRRRPSLGRRPEKVDLSRGLAALPPDSFWTHPLRESAPICAYLRPPFVSFLSVFPPIRVFESGVRSPKSGVCYCVGDGDRTQIIADASPMIADDFQILICVNLPSHLRLSAFPICVFPHPCFPATIPPLNGNTSYFQIGFGHSRPVAIRSGL